MIGNEAGQGAGDHVLSKFLFTGGQAVKYCIFSSVFVTMMSNLPLVLHLILSSF